MMKIRSRRIILRALRAIAILIAIPLIIQYYFRVLHESSRERGELLPDQAVVIEAEQNLTVWDVLRNDSRVSRFADIVGMFDDIVQSLSIPQARFTIYAPVNEAFENEHFPYDLPWFYWKFLAGYHMGPGAVSEDALRSTGTVSSFVNADIFFTYKQRISTQFKGGKMTFNHKVAHLPSATNSHAMNGFVHHVDGLIELPNSTANVLRERQNLSILREGLIRTDLSNIVNDTNTHVGQTLFAPSNAAFEKLGPKVNQFLFSPWGNRYLQALLKCHVVPNRTLFTDVYFPHGGEALVDLQSKDPLAPGTIRLPTLHPSLNLTAVISRSRPRLSITLGSDVEVGQVDKAGVNVPDIVVMDGVVHEIDSVMLPPLNSRRKESRPTTWLDANWWRGRMSVEELIERLGPWVQE